MKLAIVGCGRAGRSLGLAIAARKGSVRLEAISSRDGRRSSALARRIPGVRTFRRPEEISPAASVILLCVPDDVIPEVAARLSGNGEPGALRTSVVLHLSGALGVEPLEAARRAGAAVGSLHPLSPFPPVSSAAPDLAGTWFVPGGQRRARQAARTIIRHLRGHELAVPDAARGAYHLAATIMANHTTILAAVAMEILETRGGLRGPRLRRAFSSLLRSAASNLEESGPARALTGPASRGDVTTMEGHLDLLASEQEDLTRIYALLSARGVRIAALRGSLTPSRAARARKALRRRLKPR